MDAHYFHGSLATPRRVVAGENPASSATRWRRAMTLFGQLIIPAAFVTLAIVNVHFLDRTPDLCVYRTLFGVRCLGCGMTHAFCSVLHGQFTQAFAYNPLVVVAFPFFAMIAVRNLLSFFRNVR